MENVGYAALQVIPSLKGFDSSLEKGTTGPLTSVGRSGGAKFGDAAGRSAASSMRSHLTRAAGFIIGGFIGAAAIRKTGDLIRDSLDEARDSQKVARVTEARIKSTGGAANLTAKQVGKLSTALSNKVGIDDEVIQRGANMLLTFKGIRQGLGKNNDVFTQATEVTTDLAASMASSSGGELDLKSASVLVGKVLNDPVKGLTALTRVGVTFTDQQKANITALVDQGDTMKAQKIILKELNSEFGGTAEAQATVSDKLKVAFGNVEEALGKKLLPLVHDFQRFLLQKGIPAAEDFVKWFGREGSPAIHDFVQDAKPLANAILPAVATGLKDTAHFLKQAAGPARSVFDAFNSLPDWAQKSILIGGAAGALAKKSGLLGSRNALGSTGGGILGLVTKSKPLPVFVVNQIPGAGVPTKGVPVTAPGNPGALTKGVKLAGGPLTEAEAKAVLNAPKVTGFLARFGLAGKIASHGLGVPIIANQESFGHALTKEELRAELIRATSGKKSLPSDEVLKQFFGITQQQARGILDIPQIKATTSHVDALKQHVEQASRAIDIASNRGSQNFGGLSGKIDGASNRTDVLDRKLRGLPKSLRTELALDDREARRRLAAFRAEAQRSLSLDLAGPHIGRPGQDPSLSGVRRP